MIDPNGSTFTQFDLDLLDEMMPNATDGQRYALQGLKDRLQRLIPPEPAPV